MKVERFKMELNELLRRFAATNCDKNVSPAAASLTTQEIIEAVKEVFSLKLNVNLVCSMKGEATSLTPSSGIVTTTPDAPNIPKPNIKLNSGISRRNRSLDRLWAEKLEDSSFDKTIIADPGSFTLNVDDNLNVIKIDVPDRRMTGKELMSKSSPEVRTLIRSNTFVRDNVSESMDNDDVFEEAKFNSLTTNNDRSGDNAMQDVTDILKKFKILRDSAADVVKKYDDMALQKDMSVNSRPIRRLSAIGCFPGLHRNSTTGRTIQHPKPMRRSMLATVPSGTPTSSRLNPDVPKVKEVPVTRKSTSNMPVVTNMENSRLPQPATYRSVSSSAIILPKKSFSRNDSTSNGSQAPGVKTQKRSSSRSPSLSSLNLKNRTGVQQTKNRLYAQAQIPKDVIGLGKRKAY